LVKNILSITPTTKTNNKVERAINDIINSLFKVNCLFKNKISREENRLKTPLVSKTVSKHKKIRRSNNLAFIKIKFRFSSF
tara:strand:- start:27 stop:269 length:243 start_codon:yes stop_codon:yes gene_type:complete